MSDLEMANTRFLMSRSGLNSRNSCSRISYSLLISSASAGTKNSSTALRSMWRRNLSPRPFTSEAPSMMPGMSAMTNDWLSRYLTMPNCGSIVVKG